MDQLLIASQMSWSFWSVAVTVNLKENGLQGLEDIYEIVSEYKQQLYTITSIWDFRRFMLHASLKIEAWILIYESTDQKRRCEVQVPFQSTNH